MWSVRRLTQIEILLGYGTSSAIRCVNLLLAHEVVLKEVVCKPENASSIIPLMLQVTLRHPGEQKMRAIVSALNQISYGCREVVMGDTRN